MLRFAGYTAAVVASWERIARVAGTLKANLFGQSNCQQRSALCMIAVKTSNSLSIAGYAQIFPVKLSSSCVIQT